MCVKKGAIVLLTTACLILNGAAVQAAEGCAATYSSGAKLHIPALKLGDAFLDVVLAYSSQAPAGAQAGIWFKVETFASSKQSACIYSAELMLEYDPILLHVPLLHAGQHRFDVAFHYYPTTDGSIWFGFIEGGPTPHLAFVTSVKGTGNLSSWSEAGGQTGLAAGDAICRARAAAAGLADANAFVAWLSDDKNDAYCRAHLLSGRVEDNCGQSSMPAAAGPWVRTDGFPFADNLVDIIEESRIFAPAATDEFGRQHISTNYFTGTNYVGKLAGASPCSNWSSDAAARVASANTAFGAHNWTSGASGDCADQQALLCLQAQDGESIDPTTPYFGRIVFATSVKGTGDIGSWPAAGGKTGLAAGDAICQARASAAGLTNASNYKAWLSDSTTDAVDRLQHDGPWTRPDGVLVARNKSDLTDGLLLTTISQYENGAYIEPPMFYYAWTGTGPDGTAGSQTCNDWQDGSAASRGGNGRLFDASGWTGVIGPSCNSQYSLYCFDDSDPIVISVLE